MDPPGNDEGEHADSRYRDHNEESYSWLETAPTVQLCRDGRFVNVHNKPVVFVVLCLYSHHMTLAAAVLYLAVKGYIIR